MRMRSPDAWVRAAFSWLLVGLFGGRARMPIPDWRARPFRVLVIRDDGIGDLIVSIEVLRAIVESAPAITMDLLCSPANAPLARTLPFVNDVIVHRRLGLLRAWPTWRALRRRRYDVVIDGRIAIANVNKETQALLLSTGAPWRIGIAGRTNDRVYSVPVHPARHEHFVDYLVALAGPFGVGPDDRDWRARLPLSEADRDAADAVWTRVGAGRPRILLNPYAAMDERRWPVERFGPVLARMRERLPDATILIPTMPQGDEPSEQLARPVRAAAVPLTLPEVTAVTATADLVVSPDTAITVIASAFHVPVLALMRKNTGRWRPYGVPGGVAYSDDSRSLRDLPVERVVEALDRVLEELGPSRGWF